MCSSKRLTLILALCLCASRAHAASATFVQGAVGVASAGSVACTFPNVNVIGNDIIVMIVAVGTNTVSSVIDTGNGGTNVYTGHQSSIYAVTTAQTGYYSVAHIERQGLGGSGLVVTATLSAANSARGACAEVSNLTSCDNGGTGTAACVDTNGPKGITTCTSTSLTSCGPTTSFTAAQNDEIIFSFVSINTAISVNTETSADTGVCTSSATTTGTCSGTKWGASGSVSTTRDAAYYRNIAAGGTQTCSWSWTTSGGAVGVSCIGLKTAGAVTCGALGLLGVGCHDDALRELLSWVMPRRIVRWGV